MIRKGSSRMSKQHQWMCFQGGNKRTAFASFGTSNNFLRSVKSSFVVLSTHHFYRQLLFISLKDLFTLNYPFLLDFLGPFKIKLGVLSENVEWLCYMIHSVSILKTLRAKPIGSHQSSFFRKICWKWIIDFKIQSLMITKNMIL